MTDPTRRAPSWRLRGDALFTHGERIALETQSQRVSYAELSGRAAGVWRGLRRLGLLPGDAAALLSVGRGPDEGMALAGALCSGAIVVPLDASAPALRLAGIVAARGCRALVADAGGERLAEGIRARCAEAGWPAPGLLLLDAAGAVTATRPGAEVTTHVDARHDLGAVLHTSGSTGTPKPVPITWAGLDAFTGWTNELLGLGPSDRVLRVAELVFDLAWFDHLATWRAGATLCLMSRRDLAGGTALRAAIAALQPTVIYGVPSMFMKLCAALPPGELLPASVRAILFAGEVFPPRELQLLAERAPHAALYNFFGPTETNVCTYHPVAREALDGNAELPIGRPCPYAACHLVDEDGAVLAGAGTGELVVSGPTTVGGGPYATRDRVHRDDDGTLWFRGRIDRMVKVRGYRVEPGEVEAALARHPEVRAAAVVVCDDARLGKTLRAAVTLRPGGELAAVPPGDPTAERTLRGYLAERLPPYMVPDRLRVLDELPLTTTGKVDYGALAASG